MLADSAIKKFIRNGTRNIYWSVYGPTLRNPVLPSEIHKVLYVCKGNIVRSPFAEYISRRIIGEVSNPAFSLEFSSAGIITPETPAPPPEAVYTAMQFDISIREHKPKLINYSMLDSFDMIVTMDAWQFNYLRKIFVELRDRIYLLPLFKMENVEHADYYWKYNVVDPYGKSLRHYSDCYGRLSVIIKSFIDVVNKTNENQKPNQ